LNLDGARSRGQTGAKVIFLWIFSASAPYLLATTYQKSATINKNWT
jgi:hypothetical protein